MKKIISGLLFSLFFSVLGLSQTALETKILKVFPTAKITKSEAKYHYSEEYEIMIDQWLDHGDHSKGMFRQRIFLSHIGRKAPMLFVTEGYGARPRHYELSEILTSNQLIVEYRFFGKSLQGDIQYQYLTNEQAMEDLHRINKKFKKIYKKKWISTGISKGGTTCMYYKATYPCDVKVAVPYVGPLANAREDVRCDELIQSAGTNDCREKLFAFQRSVLMLQDSMLDMANAAAKKSKLTFKTIDGVEKAIEYATLEYTFSFFQMGHKCEEIPVNPTAKEAFEHIMKIVGIDFYSDGVIDFFKPAFYQFMTQNGYYGFMHEHLDDLIKHVDVFDNSIFAPKGVSLKYDSSYNIKTVNRLQKKGKKVIYIQGGYDPWGALTFTPAENQNALLMIKEKGSHATRIASFEAKEKEMIYDALDKWLKMEVKRK